MLNYEKTLVVVAYRLNIEGLLELNAEAPTFYQVRPVTQTALIFAVLAHSEFLSSSHISYMFIVETDVHSISKTKIIIEIKQSTPFKLACIQ